MNVSHVSRLELWIGGVAVALLAAAPKAAVACSVCSAGRDDETRAAFIATTGLLTFLPLMLVGGLVWWLRRRARQLESAESAAAVSLEPATRTSSSQ